jgi:hypothetical protein
MYNNGSAPSGQRRARPCDRLTDEQAERLLAALADTWPKDRFDEFNVAVEEPYCPVLRLALMPFEPRIRHWAGGKALTARVKRAVERWLVENTGRQFCAWRLDRDRLGWCDIVRVEERRT